MKKTIIVIIFLIIKCSLLTVDAQYIYFNKRINAGEDEVCRSLVVMGNGYLVAGGTGPGERIYCGYTDSIGNLKWTRNYTNPGYLYYFGFSGALIQSKDKNFVLFGSRTDSFGVGWGLIIKVDSLGNKIWEKDYGLVSGHSNSGYSGITTEDSGFVYTGDYWDGGTTSKTLLLKTDSIGNMQWYQTYTDNHPSRNYAGLCVFQTLDNGYCIGGGGGYWSPIAIDYHGIIEIIKTDSLGNQQWKKTYGNPIYSNGGGMLCLSKDSCIMATYSLTTFYVNSIEDYKQPYLVKLGMDGSEKWNKKIANVQPNNGTTWIHTLEDGNFILSGGHLVNDTFQKNIGWLYKIKSNGDSLWYREYAKLQGPSEWNELRQVTPTPDGGFAGAGTLWPVESGGDQDVWLFKTDSMGCLFPGCDVGISEFNPNAGAQMLIYPNPFTNAFAINYNIPKESKKGVFELRDIFGSLVYSTPLSNNVNQLQVVAGSLKAGIYLATFIVDGVTVCSKKIIKE